MQSTKQTSPFADGVISVFITNLGKYNEGELVGEWLSLPTTQDDFSASLNRIGIDGQHYEEYFLTDYESDIEGLSAQINEYTNLNELNYLATLLDELMDSEKRMYEAALNLDGSVQTMANLINLTGNLDNIQCLWGVCDDYDLGYYWINESGCYDISSLGNLANYIDYSRFGYDIDLDSNGVFTSEGYFYCDDDSTDIIYDGKTVPDEYCLY